MKVPLVDLSIGYAGLKDEIQEALGGVFEKSQYILGDSVKGFEEEFAAYCGVGGAVALNSGTSALHLSLLALGIGPGDEVICPSWTFIACVEAVMYTGAAPVLVDCSLDTFNIAPEHIEGAITERTRAIMPVHLYGRPAPMDGIMELADSRGITVIEDAAQAHGALFRGRKTGSIGRAGAFSFYPSKNLGSYGEGGAVVSDDLDLLDHIRRLRAHGEAGRYRHAELGFNMRMSGFQGAVLGVKLPHLDEWNEMRARAANKYREALDDTPVALPPGDDDEVRQVWHIFVVRAPKREELRKILGERGVGTGVHYLLPVHLQEMWTSSFGEHPPLPVSERLAGEVLSLPMFPEITGEQIEYVASVIRDFYAA